MTFGEILIQLYWADLYLRTKLEASDPPEAQRRVPKMVMIDTAAVNIRWYPVDGGITPTSRYLLTLMLEFQEDFLLTYLKKLRPRTRPFVITCEQTIVSSCMAVLYEKLKAVDIPYFCVHGGTDKKRIIFLNEGDGVLGAAALSR